MTTSVLVILLVSGVIYLACGIVEVVHARTSAKERPQDGLLRSLSDDQELVWTGISAMVLALTALLARNSELNVWGLVAIVGVGFAAGKSRKLLKSMRGVIIASIIVLIGSVIVGVTG